MIDSINSATTYESLMCARHSARHVSLCHCDPLLRAGGGGAWNWVSKYNRGRIIQLGAGYMPQCAALFGRETLSLL